MIFRIAKDYGVVEGPAVEIPSLRTVHARLGPPWRYSKKRRTNTSAAEGEAPTLSRSSTHVTGRCFSRAQNHSALSSRAERDLSHRERLRRSRGTCCRNPQPPYKMRKARQALALTRRKTPNEHERQPKERRRPSVDLSTHVDRPRLQPRPTTLPCHPERSVIFRLAKDYSVVEGPAVKNLQPSHKIRKARSRSETPNQYERSRMGGADPQSISQHT